LIGRADMVRFLTKTKALCAPHRLFRVRRRYLYTKNNTLRLRYLCGHALFLIVAITLAVQNSQTLSPETPSTPFDLALAVDNSALDETAPVAPESEAMGWHIADSLQTSISSGIRKASVAIQKATGPRVAAIEIKSGDTIAEALQRAGASGDDAQGVVKALSKHFDPRSVRAGQTLDVQLVPGDAEQPDRIASLSMEIDPLKKVLISRDNDSFTSDVIEKPMRRTTVAAYAKVQNSLYGSAERAGIPPQVLAEIIKIYSRNIDFQRDIRRGDEIEVMYEAEQTEDGEHIRNGNVLYANLTVGGRDVPIYRFETADGRADYFDEKGGTTRKTLLKTPIDGARMSSGFGMRRHPIMGYTKMHKGVDFAAPTGTPIYAAGDGAISFVGRKSGYGNYISIRHASGLSTAYAHMHKFASGMKNGKRVRQGDVIGYVGSTGRSTGPHLHYEVLVNNRQVNPRSINLPTGENLAGAELKRFKRAMDNLRQQYASLASKNKVASREAGGSPDRDLN
jgi:murein DD-endopeptidase MepM/ murein hydrolase activator NlpD